MFVATWVGSKTDEHLNFRLHVPIASFLDCLPPIPIVGSNATPIRNTDEGAPSVVHVPWKEWGKNVLFVRLTLTEYQDRFWNQCSHTCSLTMEHIDRPHQTVPSTSPNGNSLVEALVKYDFPSVMQMRRERRLSPSTLVPTESMLSEEEKELSLIRIEYHLDKEAVEVKGDDLWASPVFSAPHRRTVMKIDTPVGTHRDIIYYLSEDAVIFRHGLDV
ncbi:hypothetical protein BC835DRAFT_202906 [Cytidiella melzeri]|nr:hypothetical protein BC835DRAFT_202906 [Cytidiella melzeri]